MCHPITFVRTATAVLSLAAVMSAAAAGREAPAPEELLVADMDGAVSWKAFPASGAVPTVELVESTASTGKRSLRFEVDCDGEASPSLVLPLGKSLAGFDVLAFDFYCERYNGARFFVTVHPEGEADEQRNLTPYQAEVNPGEARDGWTTIRLVKDRLLQKRSRERPSDWANPRAVSFGIKSQAEGKMVFYLDNVRFLKADVATSRNMLFNSSFEIASNGDVPDGWRGEIGAPPFGHDVWALDDQQAWHERASLRLGHPGKTAIAWDRYVNLVPSLRYTFSVYLKSDRPDMKVRLEMNGLEKPNRKEVAVGQEWQRHQINGVASRSLTSTSVTQLGEGTLWIDAAQVEEGDEATPYQWPLVDQQALRQVQGKAAELPPRLNEPPRAAAMVPIATPPTLDGRLDEDCWKGPPVLTGFRELKTDTPAAADTAGWIGFDDEAIYLAIRARDSDMARVRRMHAGAKSAWTADTVEISLNLNGDRRSYYHFVVNPNGQQWCSHFEAPRARTRWEAPWQAAAAMLDDAWTAEVRIPYTSLNLAEVRGSVIELNVARTVKQGAEPGQTQVGTWSYSHGSFHEPRALGVVGGFDAGVCDAYRLEVTALTWQRGEARARVRNRTGGRVELECTFVADGDSPLASEPVTLALGPDEVRDVHAAFPIDRDGHCAVRLRAVDVAGRVRIVSQPALVQVSGSAAFTFAGPQFDRYVEGETAQVRAGFDGSQAEAAGCRIEWHVDSLRGELTPRQGVTVWSIPLASLPSGKHALHVRLVRPGHDDQTATAEIRIVPPAQRLVRIDRWGRFVVVDGRPFFPVGFFTETLSRNRGLEDWRSVLSDVKRNNCNSVLAYAGMATGLSQRLPAYLDVAQEVGVGVWVDISGYFVWHIAKYRGQKNRYFDESAAHADLEALMANCRQHPALLGWCGFDEPGNRPDLLTGPVVAAAAERVRGLDPHHPFFCTHLNHMGDAAIYGPGTDLGMMPFLASGGRYDMMFHDLWGSGMPVMTNSPCYGAAESRAGEPTIAQQRLNSWKAVVMGARGLQYYLYRPFSQNLWEGMGDIADQIQQLTPALLTPNERRPMHVTPASPDLLATLRCDGDRDVLIIVNTAAESQEVTVDLLDRTGVRRAEALFGSPAAQVEGGQARLTIAMKGESVAFYRIEGATPDAGGGP
jgi:hypothetical protein